jgi:hypothetical protein
MGSDPIGNIAGLPGLREPIPFFALRFEGGPGAGNLGNLTLIVDDELSALQLSVAIAVGDKTLAHVRLVVGKKEYRLRNVRLRPVSSSGELRLTFDVTPGLESLIAASRIGIYAHSPFWPGGAPAASDRDQLPDWARTAAKFGAQGQPRSRSGFAH